MNKIRVGVVRGGPSSEYEISLQTGAEVLKHLPGKYSAHDILLDKEGNWHLNGFPKPPSKIFDSSAGGVDMVFNALHGEFGEDGKVQQIFESLNVPYTGSGIVVSSLAMKKQLSKNLFSRFNIRAPKHFVFRRDEFLLEDVEHYASQVFNSMPPLWVVKPVSTGSSVGVSICGSYSELVEGIEAAFEYDNAILVEEYIKGREATCGILEDFRGEDYYALPVIEIIPPVSAKSSAGKPPFFDYGAKYDGTTREICPANFDISVKREIENIARKAHEVLGCCHYSRADFIVSPKEIYLLEVNTLPGLTSESLLPKAASATGLSFPQLLDHIISLALNKR